MTVKVDFKDLPNKTSVFLDPLIKILTCKKQNEITFTKHHLGKFLHLMKLVEFTVRKHKYKV